MNKQWHSHQFAKHTVLPVLENSLNNQARFSEKQLFLPLITSSALLQHFQICKLLERWELRMVSKRQEVTDLHSHITWDLLFSVPFLFSPNTRFGFLTTAECWAEASREPQHRPKTFSQAVADGHSSLLSAQHKSRLCMDHFTFTYAAFYLSTLIKSCNIFL